MLRISSLEKTSINHWRVRWWVSRILYFIPCKHQIIPSGRSKTWTKTFRAMFLSCFQRQAVEPHIPFLSHLVCNRDSNDSSFSASLTTAGNFGESLRFFTLESLLRRTPLIISRKYTINQKIPRTLSQLRSRSVRPGLKFSVCINLSGTPISMKGPCEKKKTFLAICLIGIPSLTML